MKMVLRVVALFVIYAGLAFLGNEAIGLLASDSDPMSAAPSTATTAGRDVSGDAPSETATSIRVGEVDGCDFAVERELTIPTAGVSALDVRAGSGDLHVEGQEGLDEIVVVGRVCASDEDFVDELTISARTSGSRAVVETHYPDFDGWGGSRTARIDLVVLLPTGLEVYIDDSSGGMEVRGTGALRIDDSSGGIDISDVDGAVEIDDSSGGIEIRRTRGDIRIDDGSGSIELRSITGGVELWDGSGSVEIEDVSADVVVVVDGSGSIEVREVGGDFVVQRDGSGSIRYSGIRGAVDIPADKR